MLSVSMRLMWCAALSMAVPALALCQPLKSRSLELAFRRACAISLLFFSSWTSWTQACIELCKRPESEERTILSNTLFVPAFFFSTSLSIVSLACCTRTSNSFSFCNCERMLIQACRHICARLVPTDAPIRWSMDLALADFSSVSCCSFASSSSSCIRVSPPARAAARSCLKAAKHSAINILSLSLALAIISALADPVCCSCAST
mmetsp:Transcript_78051/g.181025  ORF Transcript_78051/g.181025 Transcript_78051/m.181025 type:complete len:205 (+) Transcript_78051:434-1048(+)